MSQQANYFKVGLFVILAFILLVIAIVFLGAGELFEDKAYLETYMDESVQGVEVGTPVKHRGVPIGNIDKIDFVRNVYGDQLSGDALFNEGRYVYIRVALKPSAFGVKDGLQGDRIIKRMVEDGLRLQMVPQGITGVSYLEADYFDPKKNPPMEISWKPDHLYIPSAPSLFTKLGDSVEEVFSRIQDLDIEGIISDAGDFLQVATEVLKDASVGNISQETQGLLAELRQTNLRIQELLGDPHLDSVPEDTAEAVASARRLFVKSESEVTAILDQLKVTSEHAAKISQSLSQFLGTPEDGAADDLGVTVKNVRVASENLPDTLNQFNRTISRLDNLIAEQQASLEVILENIRAISENLRDVSENAKRYPSQILFGNPPPKQE